MRVHSITIRVAEKEARQIEKHLAFRAMKNPTNWQKRYMLKCHAKYGSYMIAAYSTEAFMIDLQRNLA